MAIYYTDRTKYTGPPREPSTPIQVLRVVGDITVYRILDPDNLQTRFFTQACSTRGGFSSEDMSKYQDLSEASRNNIREALRREFEITTLVDLGTQLEPGLFQVPVPQSACPSPEKEGATPEIYKDLDKCIQDCHVPYSTGIVTILGRDIHG